MKKVILLISGITTLTFLSAQTPSIAQEPSFRQEQYPAKTEDVELDSTTLPIVMINTAGGADIPDEPRISADMGIIWNGEGVYNHIGDLANNYNGEISIEVRGSSSQSFPKKCYSFELQDIFGVARNASLLGMPADNDWILYGPYTDKTFLRDALAYHLGALQGYYTPRYHYCEVMLNDDYQGIYLLMEKIKVTNDRVDIDEMAATDITGGDLSGGYLVKVDRNDETAMGADYFLSEYPGTGWPYDVMYVYVDPTYENITPEQKDYIEGYVNDFETAMNSADKYDPVNGYYKYIDMNSFVDYFIINELSRNVDAYRLSTYLYKNNDALGGKLTAGPLWDFNLTFGNADYCNAWGVTDFFTDCGTGPAWWYDLFNDPVFQNRLYCRWNELRAGPFSIDSINTWIDNQVSILGDAVDRNYSTWNILGTYVWPNYYIGATYADEIAYLKLWIAARFSWMDSNMPGDPTVCDIAGGSSIAISEFNYHSDTYNDPNAWMELHNYGPNPIDISNWVMKDETPFNSYTIPAGTTLGPDAYLVVVSDVDTFHMVHPTIDNITGPFNFGFSNSIGSLRLYDNLGGLVRQINYSDTIPWPNGADGYGPADQIIDEMGDENDPTNWMASCILGTPGSAYVPCDYQVTVSEINYNSALAYNPGDWIEVWNRGSASANIGGWIFRDAHANNIYVIPNGTILEPDDRVVISDSLSSFTEKFPTVTNVIGDFAFHLSNGGDALRLYDPVGKIKYSVRINDFIPWPTDPDGSGFTLETVDPGGNPNLAASWVAGCLYGSPGTDFVLPCPTAIDDQQPGGVMVYPNPFGNYVLITIEADMQVDEIFITDMLGNKIAFLDPTKYTQIWNGSTQAGVEAAAGLYFINVIQTNGNFSSVKLVKTK